MIRTINLLSSISFLALFVFQLPLKAQEKPIVNEIFLRQYIVGEVYKYRLTLDQSENNLWKFKLISECELKVIKDSAGIPYHEIRWTYSKMFTAKDTVDKLKEARSVEPYRISLDPGGRIDLPAGYVADMTEPIQDFNTFFVAVSSQLGAHNLKKLGDSFSVKSPIKADFSNGTTINKGDDCFEVKLYMKKITTKEVTLKTNFLPTLNPCFTYILPEMNNPVIKDTINNFQMVARAAGDKFNLQYGREFFTIESKLKRNDGKLTYATMINAIDLKVKVNCDSTFKQCQVEMPFSISRLITLELIENSSSEFLLPQGRDERGMTVSVSDFNRGEYEYAEICAEMHAENE